MVTGYQMIDERTLTIDIFAGYFYGLKVVNFTVREYTLWLNYTV